MERGPGHVLRRRPLRQRVEPCLLERVVLEPVRLPERLGRFYNEARMAREVNGLASAVIVLRLSPATTFYRPDREVSRSPDMQKENVMVGKMVLWIASVSSRPTVTNG